MPLAEQKGDRYKDANDELLHEVGEVTEESRDGIMESMVIGVEEGSRRPETGE
jgi:hypothetical protein